MNNYAIIMNVFQEDLEYYVNKLKATEVTKDECRAVLATFVVMLLMRVLL